MFKLFDENETYTLPNGVNILGKDLKNRSDYELLNTTDIVMHVTGGVLYGFQILDELAEQYHIDSDISPNDKLKQIIQKQDEEYKMAEETARLGSVTRKIAQIAAMSFTDEQALDVKDIYPEYQVDHAYKQGEFFTHEGELYKVNQAHTSASQWEPGSVGTESLYTHLTLNEDGYPIWQKPTGAHDAYNTGDIVEYNGELYKSLIDGNAYSPDEYPAGWEKYTEPTE